MYYDERASVTILCFYDMRQSCFEMRDALVKDRHEFTFIDSEGKTMTFAATKEDKLYKSTTVNFAKPDASVLVTTVKANEANYSKSEVARARRARSLQEILNVPTPILAQMLRQGSIKGCDLMPRDVWLADQIYGKSVSELKGKMTNAKPDAVRIDTVPIHIERDLILSVDILFVNGFPFLLSIDDRMGYLLVRKLSSRQLTQLQKAIDYVIGKYKSHGHSIKVVLSDPERGVVALESYLGAKGIRIDVAGTGQHVLVAERKIRQLKEHSRAQNSRQPFSALPVVLLIALIYWAARMINHIPQFSKGVSVSPSQLLEGKSFDYERYGRIPLFQYVQFYAMNTFSNTLDDRSVGGLVVGIRDNERAEFEIRSLEHSGWPAVHRTGRNMVPLPTPQWVVDLVNKKAAAEGRLIQAKRLEWRLASTGQPAEVFELEDVVSDTYHLDDSGLSMEKVYPDPVMRAEPLDAMEPDPGEAVIDQAAAEGDANALNQEEVVSRSIDGEAALATQLDPGADGYDPQLDNRNDESAVGTTEPTYNLRSRPVYACFPDQWEDKVHADVMFTNMSIKQGVQSGQDGLVPICKELQQMKDFQVWHGVRRRELLREKLRSVIRSKMFLRKKRTGEIKARLVGGGHCQDKTIYGNEEISSPTVRTPSVFMLAATGATEGRKFVTIDIKGAYLHCDIKQEVYMELDPVVSYILTEMDASYQEFIDPETGKILVQLDKALYGLVESARLFYDHLSGTLANMGFEKNPYDPCVWNKIVNGVQLTVLFHVDDIMASCKNEAALMTFAAELEQVYPNAHLNVGDQHDYLGMDFDFGVKGKVTVSMSRYISEVLAAHPVEGTAKTPAAENLFEVSDSSPLLDAEGAENFHSATAKLLYLSKRARPDVLTAVAFLTTRVQHPSEEDDKKLTRALCYIQGTQHYVMTLTAESTSILAYIDASYGVHPDGKSHTGGCISLGGGTVDAMSSRQGLVTKSSTEAELVGLSDYASQVIWTRNFLQAQGYQIADPPATVHQDNQSTMKLAEKGRSSSSRTRHVHIRFFFIKDRVDSGEIKIVYLPTDLMVSDLLTKPLQGEKFRQLRRLLLNLQDEE